jgi:hypothetical protein
MNLVRSIEEGTGFNNGQKSSGKFNVHGLPIGISDIICEKNSLFNTIPLCHIPIVARKCPHQIGTLIISSHFVVEIPT